jgi:hypothetical protein
MRPVLDLHRTFVEPETPWGKEHFSPGQRKVLNRQGFILVNGTFKLGRAISEELQHFDPLTRFLTSKVPTLIVQGDQDSIVSYKIAHRTAAQRPFCSLHTVTGADHGLDNDVDSAVGAAVSWLTDASADLGYSDGLVQPRGSLVRVVLAWAGCRRGVFGMRSRGCFGGCR